MPINYATSKVYKIISNHGDKVYVGSTTKHYLSARLAQHVTCYKAYKKGTQRYISSYNLFDEYGPENCQIILLEAHPCSNKDELKLKERYYIELLLCVNKNIPGRTPIEYYNDNKNMILEHQNIKCICDICGGKYNYSGKTLHLRTKKHINAVAAVVPDLQLSNSISDLPPV